MKKTNTLRLTTKRFRLRKLYTLMLLALPAAYVHAQSNNIYEWNGNVNNLTTEQGNWSYAGQDPLAPNGTQAIINSNSSANGETPTWFINGANTSLEIAPGYYAETLKIGSGDSNNGILTIKKDSYNANNAWASGTLSALYVGTQGGTGTVNIEGNDDYFNAGSTIETLSVAGDSPLLIGAGSGGQGTVNVLGSGKTTQMQSESPRENRRQFNLRKESQIEEVQPIFT